MQRFVDGWLGPVRIGTSMTILMYHLPPLLRQLKTDYPQLQIEITTGLTPTTLQMLKSNTLDLGLCSMPIADPAFQVTPLFEDELVAILPSNIGRVPKRARPGFLSQQPLILGNPRSALRRMIMNLRDPGRHHRYGIPQRRGDEEARGRGSWCFDCSALQHRI
jgi:DNA-binding transcriptional LysR family regulator